MRILSIGTLIAIYLSTSDEMLPIMLSNGSDITTVLKIVGLKLIIGVIIGFIIDFIFRFKKIMMKLNIFVMKNIVIVSMVF